MNTQGLDIVRIKRNVIQYWQSESWNWPVKVVSAERGSQLGASVGKTVPVRGYLTSEKFIRGRAVSEVEKILGLKPGELKNGAVLLRLIRLPVIHEFELRGYTQTPAGENYRGGAYPPGLGANQWELMLDIPASVMKVAQAGQPL